jgi:hypothetical protein
MGPGRPLRFRAEAVAVPKQKLPSRAGFRATLPGQALRLEHRQGPIEGGRDGTIAAAFGELVPCFQHGLQRYPGKDMTAAEPCLTSALKCITD